MSGYDQLSFQYKTALLEDVIPFWERNSIDDEFGGYFTCLTRGGDVFDTDKFVWLQARQVWMFSKLCAEIEPKERWLNIAKHGYDFLLKSGMDSEGNWYFALDQAGNPLTQPYNIFSDCFAAMAFGQYSLVTGDDDAAETAKSTFNNILLRKDNPKGVFNKTVPNIRPLRSFALPMILCNLILELEPLLAAEIVETQIDNSIREIFEDFYDQESGLILESVGEDGERVDSFEGRLINPGHIIEAMWFMMDIGQRRDDLNLINKSIDIIVSTLEFGWDKEFGGIYYFLDRLGHPPQQLEWDQKLWWVHLETLVALTKGLGLTGREECHSWFQKVHKYTWLKFPDPYYGEWFGYLNRRGEVLLDLKGGKWKGCFHVPRGLFHCWQSLRKIV